MKRVNLNQIKLGEVNHVGGFVENIRNKKYMCFIVLRDVTGKLQLTIEKEKQNNSKVCLVLDPPRKGCDLKVIDAIIKSDIDKIVYVSCKPSTLARDIGLIVGSLKYDNGEIKKVENPKLKYEVNFVRPFDMFANTKHIETLVCLTKI